jgi:hypothetical protein
MVALTSKGTLPIPNADVVAGSTTNWSGGLIPNGGNVELPLYLPNDGLFDQPWTGSGAYHVRVTIVRGNDVSRLHFLSKQKIQFTSATTPVQFLESDFNSLTTIYGCTYSQKTETHTDGDGNRSMQYLLSISYEDALTHLRIELNNPDERDQYSLFWQDSELAAADGPWVVLEYNEYVYVEGGSSRTNQVRLIEKHTDGDLTGKRLNWQR